MLKAILNTIFLCVAVGNNCHAQNLVPNYSFEDTVNTPTSDQSIENAIFWINPTGGTPDYFNVVGFPTAIPVPNALGFQNSKTGNAFGGFYGVCQSTFGGPLDCREYIQIKLVSPLILNKEYKIEYFVNLSNISSIALSEIGAYLSTTPISLPSISNFNLTPQVISDTTVFLTDTLNWMKISGNYTAFGGEEYLTIGVFQDETEVDTLTVTPSTFVGWCSYYYIDDVSVTNVTGVNEITTEFDFTVYPNPNNGNMTLSYNLTEGQAGEIRLYNYTGQQVGAYTIYPSGKQITIGGDHLANGVYTYRITVNGKFATAGKVVVVK